MSFFDNARVAHAKKQAKRSWHNTGWAQAGRARKERDALLQRCKALEAENARLVAENQRLERAIHYLGGQFDRATGKITDAETNDVAI